MDPQDRQNLLVAIVVAGLILGAWWLMTELHRRSQLEQCLMQRRRDCSQFAAP